MSIARLLIISLIFIGVILATNISLAQTPGEATQTPVDVTQTPAEPTPTSAPPTPTPVPTAGPGEVVFVGEVPAPPGTTVTVQFARIDQVTHAISTSTCATNTTTPADQPGISWFVLRVPMQCAVIDLPPKFCWGPDLCFLYFQENFGVSPMTNPLVAGATITLGLLSRQLPMTPSRPNVGGPRGPLLPGAGRGRTPSSSGWLWAGVALLGAGLVSGGFGLALRR
jgi:hypothetical protein